MMRINLAAKTLDTRRGTQNSKSGTSFSEPMAEGLVPTAELPEGKPRHPRRKLRKMNDEELASYAAGKIAGEGLVFRRDLGLRDKSLYEELSRRGMLDRLMPKTKKRAGRSWHGMDDSQLTDHAAKVIKENSIVTRHGLAKLDLGLYTVLMRRGLMDNIGLESRNKGNRNFKLMSDEALLSLAQHIIENLNKKSRTEFQGYDASLYEVLKKRGIINSLLEAKHADWSSMDDTKIIEFSACYCTEKGIGTKDDLRNDNPKLHRVLWKRNLLERIGLNSKVMKWSSMSDDEIIAYADDFSSKNGISGRVALRKANENLYAALSKRRLLPRICVGNNNSSYRKWDSLGVVELVSLAKSFIKKNAIISRKMLKNLDSKLYVALERRHLFERIGLSRLKKNWNAMEDADLIAFARKVMSDGNINTRSQLEENFRGLSARLRLRGLLGELEFDSQWRKWARLSDDQLVEYAREHAIINQITRRSDLGKRYKGLYGALRERNLLDRVFWDLDKSKSANILSGLSQAALAMEKFGGEEG